MHDSTQNVSRRGFIGAMGAAAAAAAAVPAVSVARAEEDVYKRQGYPQGFSAVTFYLR